MTSSCALVKPKQHPQKEGNENFNLELPTETKALTEICSADCLIREHRPSHQTTISTHKK
jgi:hypothetical protein